MSGSIPKRRAQASCQSPHPAQSFFWKNEGDIENKKARRETGLKRKEMEIMGHNLLLKVI